MMCNHLQADVQSSAALPMTAISCRPKVGIDSIWPLSHSPCTRIGDARHLCCRQRLFHIHGRASEPFCQCFAVMHTTFIDKTAVSCHPCATEAALHVVLSLYAQPGCWTWFGSSYSAGPLGWTIAGVLGALASGCTSVSLLGTASPLVSGLPPCFPCWLTTAMSGTCYC